MKREEVFDEISAYITTQLANGTKNPYGATLLNVIPTLEEANFPTIVITQIEYSLDDETLAKTEQKHRVSIEAQIFAVSTATVNRRTIANQLADLVEDCIANYYGFTLESALPVQNLVENIYRVVMRFSGLIDDTTKKIYRE